MAAALGGADWVEPEGPQAIPDTAPGARGHGPWGSCAACAGRHTILSGAAGSIGTPGSARHRQPGLPLEPTPRCRLGIGAPRARRWAAAGLAAADFDLRPFGARRTGHRASVGSCPRPDPRLARAGAPGARSLGEGARKIAVGPPRVKQQQGGSPSSPRFSEKNPLEAWIDRAVPRLPLATSRRRQSRAAGTCGLRLADQARWTGLWAAEDLGN
jgi:hypothetical protein